MTVTFYPQNPKYWNSGYRLIIANVNFDILRELLALTSETGDNTGTVNADELMRKLTLARTTLQRGGKEWERSEEPPPEGQEDQSLKILGTPGLSQDDLHHYLNTLEQIARFARSRWTGVKWS